MGTGSCPSAFHPSPDQELGSVATLCLLQTRAPQCAHKETCRDGGAVLRAGCVCDSWSQKKKQDEPPSLESRAGRRMDTAVTGGFREVPSHSQVTGGCGVAGASGLGGPPLWKKYFLARGHPYRHLATEGLPPRLPCVLVSPDVYTCGSVWNTDLQAPLSALSDSEELRPGTGLGVRPFSALTRGYCQGWG